MQIPFYKYQGAGNDFVIMDNRSLFFDKNDTKLIARLCDRKFGIGADGLLLLEEHPSLDFAMVYFNADGNPSSMCGNGGRCLVRFAQRLGVISEKAVFEATDGIHRATVLPDGQVSLQMQDVSEIRENHGGIFLDTGSPHHVMLVEELSDYDVYAQGKKLRHELYGAAGANINFVEQKSEDTFAVRTYERGVENETLSCGTGVTAVAIAMYHLGKTVGNTLALHTPGGSLSVSFQKQDNQYTQVFLQGPATAVFEGTWKNEPL